jgi:hypothetical protein
MSCNNNQSASSFITGIFVVRWSCGPIWITVYKPSLSGWLENQKAFYWLKCFLICDDDTNIILSRTFNRSLQLTPKVVWNALISNKLKYSTLWHSFIYITKKTPSCMYCLMFDQISFIRVYIDTLITTIRFLSYVCSLVWYQMARLTKTLPTLITAIGVLSCVFSDELSAVQIDQNSSHIDHSYKVSLLCVFSGVESES